MARITVNQAKAWLEATKLQHPATLDADLLAHSEAEVLGRLASSYDVSTWVDTATTPLLVQTIISKQYAAMYYGRQYSEDVGPTENTWERRLLANVELLIGGIVDGSIQLVDVANSVAGEPSFYPNDASSAMEATSDDPSLGGPAFSMGMKF